MPANLTPQYREAEERFRTAATHDEKLAGLREMLALLPKHKGTEKLQADLRKRLAKLEDEGAHPPPGGARHADPGHVRREGAGQWVLLGPPNAGKSALLAALTHAHPEVAPYPFTTRVPLAGMMPHEDVQVQLVDTPAVSAQHSEPWMPNLVRNADGLLLVFDPGDDALGAALAALQALFERAHVAWSGAGAGGDGHPFTLVRPVRVAFTRIDEDPDGTLRAIAGESLEDAWPRHAVSATRGDGLAELRAALWEGLGRIRVYAKEPGRPADRERPFVLERGATVEALAQRVHKDVAARLKFARLWGHAAFAGQQVDRHHPLADRDVVELHA
jgi:ribosome-interacting GTPase 1